MFGLENIYLAITSHGITQIAFQNMFISQRGRTAEDGGRRSPLGGGHSHQLCLDIVDWLGQIQIKICFISILAVINYFQG